MSETTATAPAQTAELPNSRRWDHAAAAVTTVIQDSNGAKHPITVHVILGEKKCPACGRTQATMPEGSVDIEGEISGAIASIETRAAAVRKAFASSPKYAAPAVPAK